MITPWLRESYPYLGKHRGIVHAIDLSQVMLVFDCLILFILTFANLTNGQDQFIPIPRQSLVKMPSPSSKASSIDAPVEGIARPHKFVTRVFKIVITYPKFSISYSRSLFLISSFSKLFWFRKRKHKISEWEREQLRRLEEYDRQKYFFLWTFKKIISFREEYEAERKRINDRMFDEYNARMKEYAIKMHIQR